MKKMKKVTAAVLVLTALSACTHERVQLVKVTDTEASCAQISNEMSEIASLRASIKDKTGFSGRNVGMGILFWPGVVMNEYNATNADELAAQRQVKLVEMYNKKGCKSIAKK